MGSTWGPPGSCRPKMGPCWPHEPCYQGVYMIGIKPHSGSNYLCWLLPYPNYYVQMKECTQSKANSSKPATHFHGAQSKLVWEKVLIENVYGIMLISCKQYLKHLEFTFDRHSKYPDCKSLTFQLKNTNLWQIGCLEFISLMIPLCLWDLRQLFFQKILWLSDGWLPLSTVHWDLLTGDSWVAIWSGYFFLILISLQNIYQSSLFVCNFYTQCNILLWLKWKEMKDFRPILPNIFKLGSETLNEWVGMLCRELTRILIHLKYDEMSWKIFQTLFLVQT